MHTYTERDAYFCFKKLFSIAQELCLSDKELLNLVRLQLKLLHGCEEGCSLQSSIEVLKKGLKNSETYEFEVNKIKQVIDFLFGYLFFNNFSIQNIVQSHSSAPLLIF